MPTTVVLFSGGLDSTVLLATTPHALAVTINYGQRHQQELRAASAICARLEVEHLQVDMPHLAALLPGSALTDPSIAVPEGHYQAPSMRATIVPQRNLIFLSVAASIAMARGAHTVLTAVHAGDQEIYPDCRLSFITAAQTVMRLGMDTPHFALRAPFLFRTKAEIVTAGDIVRAPMHLSWSCYTDGSTPCGRCAADVERREAFALAGVLDRTTYLDTNDFWRDALHGVQ